MPSTSNLWLQKVAIGLKELKDQVAFVGGAVAELYASDPAASEIRPTDDVDCVIELSSRIEYNRLETSLRSKGFTNDISHGAPICRWIFEGIKVDVMPTDEQILGFSNQWYEKGIENKIVKSLDDGTEIFVFPPEYYVAAKFEAHKERGGTDLRQSQDFEDIIYVFENCLTILEDISDSDSSVKQYLSEECQNLLKNDYLTEGIECSMPYESDSDSIENIEDKIASIAKI